MSTKNYKIPAFSLTKEDEPLFEQRRKDLLKSKSGLAEIAIHTYLMYGNIYEILEKLNLLKFTYSSPNIDSMDIIPLRERFKKLIFELDVLLNN